VGIGHKRGVLVEHFSHKPAWPGARWKPAQGQQRQPLSEKASTPRNGLDSPETGRAYSDGGRPVRDLDPAHEDRHGENRVESSVNSRGSLAWAASGRAV